MMSFLECYEVRFHTQIDTCNVIFLLLYKLFAIYIKAEVRYNRLMVCSWLNLVYMWTVISIWGSSSAIALYEIRPHISLRADIGISGWYSILCRFRQAFFSILSISSDFFLFNPSSEIMQTLSNSENSFDKKLFHLLLIYMVNLL